MIQDDQLREELRSRASRERVAQPLEFDLALGDGTTLEGCSLGGSYGEWHDVYIPELGVQ
jgi:hypothetical protein